MRERIRRMQRLAELVEQQEQRSRIALSAARRDRDEAAHALQSVFLQCREVAHRPEDFSAQFGRSLIEAGWLAERARRAALEAALDAADRRLEEWHEQRARVDALDRLIDRLEEAKAEDDERRTEGELGDLISARSTSRRALTLVEGVA